MNDDLVTKIAYAIFSDRRRKYGDDVGFEPTDQDFDTARELIGDGMTSEEEWTPSEDDWILEEEGLADVESDEVDAIIEDVLRDRT